MKLLSVLSMAALLVSAAACSRETSPPAAPDAAGSAAATAPTPIVVQLDWVAEPEHGGFYQAQARGWFREAGLEVQLIPGGPGATSPLTMVASGRAQFGQNDSTNVLLAIAEGLPVVNVAAVFQRDPSVFMLHASNPISKWEELDGHTLMARPGWVFLPFLRKKYGIDFQIVPQNFSLQQFAADPEFIQQGYYIAEPWHLMQLGVKPKWLHVWDAGFDAYAVVIGNRDWLRDHGDAARRFIAAYARGWRDYCEGDPAPAHAAMMAANPDAKPEFLEWSRQQIIQENLTRGHPERGEDYAIIQRERFANQIRQLEALDILPRGKVTADQVMTDEYLPHQK